MRIKSCLALTVIAALAACGKKTDNSATNAPQTNGPTASTSATNNALGDKMLGALQLSLATDLTPAQITIVATASSTKAKAALSTAALNLTTATEADKVILVASSIVSGAIESLTSAGVTLAGDAPKLKKIVKLIQSGILKSIKTENIVTAASMTDANKKNMFKQIFSSSVSSLNEGGFTGTDAAAFVGELVQDGITNLDDSGIGKTELGQYVGEALDGASIGLAGAGIPANLLNGAVSDIAADAVAVIDDFELTAADKLIMAEDITGAMIGSLENAGVPPEGINAACAEVMTGIMGSLDDAQFDPASVQSMSDNLIQAAMAEVGNLESIAGAGEIGGFIESLTDGMIGGLDEAGVAKADIDNVAASIAATAVTTLSDIDGVLATDIAAITAKIEDGVAAGLGDAGYSTTDITDVQAAIDQEINQAKMDTQVEVNQAEIDAAQTTSGVTWRIGSSCADLPITLDLSAYSDVSYANGDGYFCTAATGATDCSQITQTVTGGSFTLVTADALSYCVFKPTLTGSWTRGCFLDTDDGDTPTEEVFTITGANFTYLTKSYSDSECTEASKLLTIKMTGQLQQPAILANGSMLPLNLTLGGLTMMLNNSDVVTAANTESWYGMTSWEVNAEKSVAGLSRVSTEGPMPNIDSSILDVLYMEPGATKGIYMGVPQATPDIRPTEIDWSARYIYTP